MKSLNMFTRSSLDHNQERGGEWGGGENGHGDCCSAAKIMFNVCRVLSHFGLVGNLVRPTSRGLN